MIALVLMLALGLHFAEQHCHPQAGLIGFDINYAGVSCAF